MAAAIYNKLTHSSDAESVGTYTGAPDEPEGQILSNLFNTSHFFEVMEKHGMNVRNNTTRRLEPHMLDEYEVVVSMAEEPYIPQFLKDSKKVIWLDIPNPNYVDQKIAEETYEKIFTFVKNLLSKQKLT